MLPFLLKKKTIILVSLHACGYLKQKVWFLASFLCSIFIPAHISRQNLEEEKNICELHWYYYLFYSKL